MADQVTIQLSLSRERAWAFAELVKRLARNNLGPSGLKLTNPHQPEEEYEAERAVDDLRKALADAGFDPR